jgi:hypothetical protein
VKKKHELPQYKRTQMKTDKKMQQKNNPSKAMHFIVKE